MLFYGILMGSYLLLFFLSRYEEINVESISVYMKPFYKIGHYIIRKSHSKKEKKESINKLKNAITLLYPEQNSEKLAKQFYYEKVSMTLAVIFLGIIVSGVIAMTSESVLDNKGDIVRKTYLKSGQDITLNFKCEANEIEENITFTVTAQQYNDEQLEQLYVEFVPVLEQQFLGENAAKESIYFNVNCMEEITGYPFNIEWETGNHEILSTAGTIKNEYLPEVGTPLCMIAKIRYGKLEKEHKINLIIYPPQYTEKEKFVNIVKEELENADKKSRYENIFSLPKTIDGIEVIWSDLPNNENKYIFVLFLAVAVICYFKKEQDLKEKLRKREVELLWEYPTIVSKLTLYLSAGMTVKGAWVNVLKNGNLKNAPKIYGEMQMSCYEMDCGVSEIVAYEKFGRRCALQPYIKLTALLVQNIEKGNSILLQRLKEETQLAFIERKNKAKIKAEEASTKLLLPMIIFMGIVMIMIMVPAFQQF